MENESDVLKIKAELLVSGLKIKDKIKEFEAYCDQASKQAVFLRQFAVLHEDSESKNLAIVDFYILASKLITTIKDLYKFCDESTEILLEAASMMSEMELELNNLRKENKNEDI